MAEELSKIDTVIPIIRIYYWIHHTSSYDGNTGVQRVVRALGKALAPRSDVELIPVRWCAEREAIVAAEGRLLEGLACFSGPLLPEPASAGQPLHLTQAAKLKGAWLVVPEVPHVDPDISALPAMPVMLDYARYYGLRSAFIFYDLIPIRSPGYEAMRDAHSAYALALAAADLVLPISHAAGADLETWWHEVGHDLRRVPQLRPLPLAAEMVGIPRAASTPVQRPQGSEVRLLALGTVEPRKNQLRLMEAVNRLISRRPDLSFRLDVVGGLHGAVAEAALRAEAQSNGRIKLHNYLQDDAVRNLTAACDATAFVSLAEGYGLPIVESLWQGKPCLCSDVPPMSEIAEGGGCLLVDPHDGEAIEQAVERLVSEPELRRSLTRAACRRLLPTWDDYGQNVLRALREAPALSCLVLIEGRRGGGEALAQSLEGCGTLVKRLRWQSDSKSIIPAFREGAPATVAPPGDGDLRGLWALVPLSSAADPAEAMQIEDEARALGLRIALLIGRGQAVQEAQLSALATVDLALFATAAERDAALGAACRFLPRTATLGYRLRVAEGASDIAEELFSKRSRTTAAGVPKAPRRLFYWADMTASQPFNTGIQRVTRSLAAALRQIGVDLVPVKWNAAANRLTLLNKAEAETLADWGGPAYDGNIQLPNSLKGEWLLHPEVTVPTLPLGSNVPRLARSLGMRVASIFYDLIPAKLTHIYRPAIVDAFCEYWAGFAEADVALPISWTVAGDLRRHLNGSGLRVPPIVPCVLAGNLLDLPRQAEARPGPKAGEPLRLLAVGTWEPRKNYPRLLQALIEARSRYQARPIELAIVGRKAGFKDLDRTIERLAAEAGGVSLHQHLADRQLVELFQVSHASVYSSWEEGFGLPVLESLWRGLPCLCHNGSSLAEIAPGGGTLAVDMLDPSAIADGILRFAADADLLTALTREAVSRPIRDWTTYAHDIVAALARTGTAPGWPLPSVFVNPKARPLLSCAITTYNRAKWLTHSLPRLIEAAKPFGSAVEIVVCDNASTDATPEVVARHAGVPGLVARRNPMNVGMLGNLGATVRAANGQFVWLIGDDDLVMREGLAAVLHGIESHADIEMAYMNYAYTNFDAPEQLSDPDDIIRAAKPIGYGGPDRRVDELRQVAALNENLFTAIYACAFRRDHALRAYQQDTSGAPFSSLATCVPSSTYALAALQDRPAWWVGQPAIVVNMNVSWLRWALLWHLERMPDLFDVSELASIDPVRLDRHRHKHCWNAGEWTRAALMQAEDAIRRNVSIGRLLERCKHIPSFGPEVPKVYAAYREAWQAGRVVADSLAPDELFARYGLERQV